MNANEGITPKTFIIVRGLPGTGKSHKAQRMLRKHGAANDGHLFSLDSIEDAEGGAAKRKLLDMMKLAMDQGIDPIVWDAPNLIHKAMSNASDYADKAGYSIKVEYPDSKCWKELKPLLHDKESNLEKILQILGGVADSPIEDLEAAVKQWEPSIKLVDVMGRDKTTKTKQKEKIRQPIDTKRTNDSNMAAMRKMWKAFLDD